MSYLRLHRLIAIGGIEGKLMNELNDTHNNGIEKCLHGT